MHRFEIDIEEVSLFVSMLPPEARSRCVFHPETDDEPSFLLVPDEWSYEAQEISGLIAAHGEDAALDARKADATRRAIARADALTAPVLAAYPEAERAGWEKREAEARAIIAAADDDGNVTAAIADTLIVKALAEASGWSQAQTIEKARSILEKAAGFAAISAAVETLRESAMAAIDAAADADELEAALETLDAEAAALAAQFGLA